MPTAAHKSPEDALEHLFFPVIAFAPARTSMNG